LILGRRSVKCDGGLFGFQARYHRFNALQVADLSLDRVYAMRAGNIGNRISNRSHNMLLLRLDMDVKRLFMQSTLSLGSCIEYISNLFQHSLSLIRIFTPYGSDQARVHVFLQDHRADFVQRTLNSLYLADNVNTIDFILDHSLNATDMTFNGFQPY
jgi:hypothetical protein